jgi:hypothetical protein
MGSICSGSSGVIETERKNNNKIQVNSPKDKTPKGEYALGKTNSFHITLANMDAKKTTIFSPIHQIRNFFTKEDSWTLLKQEEDIAQDLQKCFGIEKDVTVIRHDAIATLISGKIGDTLYIAKRRSFNDFSIFSDFLLYIQNLCKFRIKGLNAPLNLKLGMENVTLPDETVATTYKFSMLREHASISYQKLLEAETIKETDYDVILRILGHLGKILKKLHKQGKPLKPI